MAHSPEIQEILERFNTDWVSIDTPEDWHPFIIECNKELALIDPDYKVFQIKQKMGGLRYYYTATNPEVEQQMFQTVLKWEEKVAEYEQSKKRD